MQSFMRIYRRQNLAGSKLLRGLAVHIAPPSPRRSFPALNPFSRHPSAGLLEYLRCKILECLRPTHRRVSHNLSRPFLSDGRTSSATTGIFPISRGRSARRRGSHTATFDYTVKLVKITTETLRHPRRHVIQSTFTRRDSHHGLDQPGRLMRDG